MTRGLMMAAGLVVALVTTSACERSREQQARDDAERTAAEATDTIRAASEAGAAAAVGIEQANGPQMAAGAQRMSESQAEPADFRDLQKFFPDLAGWTKSKPTGERVSVGIRLSRAEVTYARGAASMRMEITDSSLNQAMIAPIAMMLAAGYEKESEGGFERSAKIGGQPGWEKWDAGSRSGELNAVVAKRFIVKVDGSNVDDLSPLHQLADEAGIANLESLQ